MIRFSHLVRSKEGATAVEYAVLIGFIIAILIGVISAIGLNLIPGFETVGNAI